MKLRANNQQNRANCSTNGGRVPKNEKFLGNT